MPLKHPIGQHRLLHRHLKTPLNGQTQERGKIRCRGDDFIESITNRDENVADWRVSPSLRGHHQDGSDMLQGDEYTSNRAHVSALTSVVQTLLAHILALEPTREAADALVARLRGASRHVPRFVADDDQHA